MNLSPSSRFRRRNIHIACRTQSTFSPNARTYGHQNTKNCLSDITAGQRRDGGNASSNVFGRSSNKAAALCHRECERRTAAGQRPSAREVGNQRDGIVRMPLPTQVWKSTRIPPTATAPPRQSPARPRGRPDTATSATVHRPVTRGRSHTRHRTPRRMAARISRCPSPR